MLEGEEGVSGSAVFLSVVPGRGVVSCISSPKNPNPNRETHLSHQKQWYDYTLGGIQGVQSLGLQTRFPPPPFWCHAALEHQGIRYTGIGTGVFGACLRSIPFFARFCFLPPRRFWRQATHSPPSYLCAAQRGALSVLALTDKPGGYVVYGRRFSRFGPLVCRSFFIFVPPVYFGDGTTRRPPHASVRHGAFRFFLALCCFEPLFVFFLISIFALVYPLF